MKHVDFPRLMLVLPAVAAFTLLALASAGSASPGATRGGEAVTLQFLSVEKHFAAVPAIDKSAPPQVGGRLVFDDVTYNRVAQLGKPKWAVIGRAEGVCTIIDPARPEAQCLITAHMPNGQIVVAGEGDPGAKVVRYAITGGIGAYANARGTVTATALDPHRSLIVVHLARSA
jgi:hypothetical protein